MTEELLPPDPSKDGWYWIYHTPNGKKGNGLPVPFVFFHEHRLWFNYDNERPRKASDMWAWGWRLASPHPIPGPEELDEIVRVAVKTNQNLCEMAQNLRAALGAKP